MYKISVPITCKTVDRQGREGILEQLHRLNAERVFLALDTYPVTEEKRKNMLENLREECRFFHEQGFEVGAWTWTFAFREETPFTPVLTVEEEETVLKNISCAFDPDFRAFAAEYIKDLARCGVDLILFDDDFRYGCIGSQKVGCLCPYHTAEINRLTGKNLTRAELAKAILTGGKNPHRDAWIQANGDSFRLFAKEMRQALDEVNPDVRMGACACLSSWDLDGTNPYELAVLLAGKTRPLMRLSAAPYWPSRHSWGCRIGDVIEQARWESVFTRRGDIEIFGEGDVNPRPRTICPAAYLEGFDTAMRADGHTDGLLKYAIDYTSSAHYENGYIERHVRNRPLYEGIDRLFSGKSAVGVRIYFEGSKVAHMELGETPAQNSELYYTFFSSAARCFAASSIPTVYEGEGVTGACFGEAAWSLDRKNAKNGLILDGTAAQILHRRGIDTGIRTIGKPVTAPHEIFSADGEVIDCRGTQPFFHEFSDQIQIESYGETDRGNVPFSYTYENVDGERFLVLNFDTRVHSKELYTPSVRHYARSRQLARAVSWLSHGALLPAYAYGNPDLYLMTKKGEDGSLTVGLWNFCIDSVLEPRIVLDKDYSQIEFLHTSGSLEGNTVRLSELPAFGFAAFEVR